MSTYTLVVPVQGTDGYVNGVTVTAWKSSRFGNSNVPSQGTAVPSGTADATATSADIGANGQAVLTLPSPDVYNICATYGGINYWTQDSSSLSGNALVGYYASFYDTTTQVNAGATSANLVTLNTTDVASGISVVSGSQITFANAGAYNLQMLGQFITTGGGSNYGVTVWYTVNGGAPATGSGYTFTTSGVNNQVLATVADTNSFNAGDYIQFYWWSQNTYMRLLSTATGSSPTRPLSPSVKINIFNVG